MSSGLIEVPLGLELVFPGGRVRHDYSQLPAPGVVRALARAHLSLTNSGGGIKTPGTSWLYARAIRRIARFFERELAIDALGALDAAAYRRLIADVGGGHLEACVRALLLRLVETDPDAVHPSVRPLLVAPYLLQPPQSVPIPPLSGTDAKRLEAACKQSILALEARLAEGERLLVPVTESEKLTDGERVERQIIEVAAREGVTRSVPRRLREDRRARLVGQLMGLLFPRLRDLAPFLLLLGLRTGLSPECLDALTVDAFEDLGNGHIRLRWFKARGGGLEADTFSGRGQWSAGGLLRRAVAVTARARRIAAPEVGGHLWLYSPYGGRQPIRALEWSLRVAEWVASVDLRGDDGELLAVDRRQLRKTHSQRLNTRYRGALELVAGANQSTRVAAKHYVNADPNNPALLKTITDAQTALLGRARATVLTEPRVAALAGSPASAARALEVSEGTARALIASEELDVFLAKCKDFHNSPFGSPGTACPAAAWDCLFCPLAVITPSKAPALIALKRRLERLRETMPLDRWQQVYGPAHWVIGEEILPQFSAGTRERAEALADGEVLHLPLAAQTG
jgi:hypothetical protein